MDLLDQIRAARETERLAILSQPGFTDATGSGTGIGMEGIMAAAAIEDQIASMIQKASDPELRRAYQRVHGKPGDAKGDGLLAEIRRRGRAV